MTIYLLHFGNNFMKIKTLKDSIIIDDRWQMYDDGVVYDTKYGKDIPHWIFEFRDFVLEKVKKKSDYEMQKPQNM